MYKYNAKITNVVDGDTVDAVIDLGFKLTTVQRLRIAHIDTPERGTPGFEEAKKLLQSIALNKSVVVCTQKATKWGYYLAEIEVEGKDVSGLMLESNLAKPYEGGTKTL